MNKYLVGQTVYFITGTVETTYSISKGAVVQANNKSGLLSYLVAKDDGNNTTMNEDLLYSSLGEALMVYETDLAAGVAPDQPLLIVGQKVYLVFRENNQFENPGATIAEGRILKISKNQTYEYLIEYGGDDPCQVWLSETKFGLNGYFMINYSDALTTYLSLL